MRLVARENVLPILERDTQDAKRSKSRAASAMKKAKRSDLQLSRYDSAEDSDEEVAVLRSWALLVRHALALCLVCAVLVTSARRAVAVGGGRAAFEGAHTSTCPWCCLQRW